MIKNRFIRTLAYFENENFAKNFPLDYCLPLYHNVSNEYLPHLKHVVNYKNEKEFEADLDCLSKHFQWVTFDEFKDYLKGNFKPKRRLALLTFDDGYREFLEVAVPILERKGIYAINFVNPAFVDNRELMFRCKASLLKEKFNTVHFDSGSVLKLKYQDSKTLDDLSKQFEVDFNKFLKEKKPYLTLDQLQQIKNKGFGISSHGWNHPLYHETTISEQLENTDRSYRFMKENNFHYESFAFPFTDFGVEKAFFDELLKNEDIVCTFGTAGIKLDSVSKNFQRIPMETGENAETILKKEISYFRMKKYLNKNYIQRK